MQQQGPIQTRNDGMLRGVICKVGEPKGSILFGHAVGLNVQANFVGFHYSLSGRKDCWSHIIFNGQRRVVLKCLRPPFYFPLIITPSSSLSFIHPFMPPIPHIHSFTLFAPLLPSWLGSCHCHSVHQQLQGK